MEVMSNEVLENVTALTSAHKELERKMWLRKDKNTGALRSRENCTFQIFKTPYLMHRRLRQALLFQGCFVY